MKKNWVKKQNGRESVSSDGVNGDFRWKNRLSGIDLRYKKWPLKQKGLRPSL